MDYSTRSVSLDRIDTADQTFKITTHSDISDLALSISAIGLLQPPLLVPKGRIFTIVSGFRRIAACRSNSLLDIPARIGQSSLPEIDYARWAIADNAFQRPLNVIEQSRAYALIQRFADDPADWMEIAASIGLPGSQTAMKRLLPIADMPESLRDAILDGSIALPIALRIIELAESEASALVQFFKRINTGLNIQRELFEFISEIAARDSIAIETVLEQDDIQAILGEEDLPAPQKAQDIRHLLKRIRYPELSRAESRFDQQLRSLKLNPCIQLHPPRFFEGNLYRLTVTINSRRQLRSLLPDMEKIADQSRIIPD